MEEVDKDLFELWAEGRNYLKKLESTKSRIKEVLQNESNVGLSFSGGKDSLVLLHLIQSINNTVKVVFFDSGAEYPETLTMLDYVEAELNVDLEIVLPEYNIWDLHKGTGAFGYKGERFKNWSSTPKIYKENLIRLPARCFQEANNINIQCIGLRAEESKGRMQLLKNGDLQEYTYDTIKYFYPLAFWTYQDIWAYIISNNLQYNKIYDKLKFSSFKTSRVGSYLGTTNLTSGRFLFLKHYHPEIWKEVRETFPILGTYV